MQQCHLPSFGSSIVNSDNDSSLTSSTSLTWSNTLNSTSMEAHTSVVVLEGSHCLEDQSPCPCTLSPCPQTTSHCPWTTKSSKIVKDFAFCKQSVTYNHMVHKFGYCNHAWGYSELEEWLTYWYPILVTDIYISVSKIILHCNQDLSLWKVLTSCPQGSSRTNLQVPVLVLGPQVLDNVNGTHTHTHLYVSFMSNGDKTHASPAVDIKIIIQSPVYRSYSWYM